MTQPTRLEIGTVSFAGCGPKMVLPPKERVRLILAAAEAYKPDLLVTAEAAQAGVKTAENMKYATAQTATV